MGDVSSRHFQNGPKCSLRGVLSSMGWQHHPPRHAAARAALGVQAAHAILGMAPRICHPQAHDTLMRREHARDTVGSPRTQQQSPRAPYTLHPGRVPCPPCGHALPHATSALPAHSAPSLPVSARPLERACCLGKTCQWPTSRLARGLTHASRPTLPIKRHTDAPPPCNECPPRALGPVSARRGALEPSSEHVASEKLANGQRRGSPRGSPMPPARRCPSKGTRMPLPPCNESPSRVLGPSSRLVEEPSSPRASMLPRKNVLVANVAAHPGAHPCPRPTLPIERHTDAPPPCNECPPRALGPVSARRGALKPSSEHVASEKRAGGQRRGSPRGSPMPPLDVAHRKAHGCPSPMQRVPSRALGPSRLVEEPSSPRASVLPPKGAGRIVAMPISVLRRLHSLLPCAGRESPPDESRFDA